MNHEKHVRTLFTACLSTTLELGERQVDKSSIHMGDAECEPFYSVEFGGESLVVEGDYEACTVRIRTLDGKTLCEVNARAPLALSLEAAMAWGRAQSWRPPESRGDEGPDLAPETSPAPLDGPISRFFLAAFGVVAGLAQTVEPFTAALSV